MCILMMLLMLIPLLMSLSSIQYNSFYLMKILLTKLFNMNISIDIMMDWISLFFLSTVMLISSLIILFSKYYIPNKEQNQFMLMLLMFVLSMSILILSNNLFLMLLGWDGLGLSSYILVIYYQNYSSASSGTITLLSNRIGDILILLSMSLITMSMNWNFNMNFEFSKTTMLLLLIAACSKSAQFPFSAWLPMAMAAPTPISALVHSSTLVTAGVFIMLRISTSLHPLTMMILLMISSSTAIYASMSANWEQDLKKIIALSTLSQIAMMMFAISMNSLVLAFMHLIIHALFKSAMFLCAGIMIHESSYQDMRMMGLNFSKSSLTLSMLGINTLALMGIPFMSGFFSKDSIIENMMISTTNSLMSLLMIMSIGMTTTYSIRMAISSNKPFMKMIPISSNHQMISNYIPIILLSMMAITSGSWLTWIFSSEQTFIMNNYTKFMILVLLIMGFMLGLFLQFKSKKFMKFGFSSIPLWFIHIISVIPTNLFNPIMKIFQNNDKTWKEMYGPNKSNNLMMMYSYIPEKTKSTLMMILIMTSILPMFFL
uniref:NADH-ubiquinone oxidoreductase chain 5 n=1 Tax=Phintella cavaleriei TaxID=1112466 RepID=A0A8A9WFW8_9ARAC|nr:NADH dehydrogenase subunit 5 [Phintella cavaleriei]QTT58092.1 NADH dehydrogenase subunit 5 [Phintella cavaleriei]